MTQVPPLRVRPGDIADMARYFVGQAARRKGLPQARLTDEAIRRLESYTFPNNIKVSTRPCFPACHSSVDGQVVAAITYSKAKKYTCTEYVNSDPSTSRSAQGRTSLHTHCTAHFTVKFASGQPSWAGAGADFLGTLLRLVNRCKHSVCIGRVLNMGLMVLVC